MDPSCKEGRDPSWDSSWDSRDSLREKRDSEEEEDAAEGNKQQEEDEDEKMQKINNLLKMIEAQVTESMHYIKVFHTSRS